MEQLAMFYAQYGWQLTIIALLGIILLGVLKYANVFNNIAKENRKPVYLAISLGFSIIASIVYLLIVDRFSVEYMLTVTPALFALNQGMYAVYENTKLRDLLKKVFEKLMEELNKKFTNKESK